MKRIIVVTDRGTDNSFGTTLASGGKASMNTHFRAKSIALTTRPIIREEECCVQWIIESPTIFKKYVGELFAQCEGREGRFVLSKHEREVDVTKTLELVTDPFLINVNDRKILNKLYVELEKNTKDDELYLETQSISQQIYGYLLKLEQKTEMILDVNMELEWSSIFKAAGIKYEL